jgi:hypothetical protein
MGIQWKKLSLSQEKEMSEGCLSAKYTVKKGYIMYIGVIPH